MAVAPALGRCATSSSLKRLTAAIEIVAERRAFADIQRVQNRLLRKEHEALDELSLFRRHFELAKGLLLFEGFFGAQEQGVFALELAGALLLQVFLDALEALLDLGQVADHQVELDVLDVAQGIDGADVRNGVVFKGAQHVNERVDVAQAGEEGGFLQGFLADGGDVDVFDGGEGGLLGRVEGGELVEPLVGHARHADVRLARIGVAALFELGLGQDLEQRCLAYLRQADDAGFHALPVGASTRCERVIEPLR